MIKGDTVFPHLFLASSQYSRCGIRLSLIMFQLAGKTVTHNMYHEPSLLVGATVLFCTFAVSLSLVPNPTPFLSTKHLYFPFRWTLV